MWRHPPQKSPLFYSLGVKVTVIVVEGWEIVCEPRNGRVVVRRGWPKGGLNRCKNSLRDTWFVTLELVDYVEAGCIGDFCLIHCTIRPATSMTVPTMDSIHPTGSSPR